MTPAGMQTKSDAYTDRYFQPSPRIQSIRETLLDTPYSICLERPSLLLRHASTQEARKNRLSHPFVRRAAALRFLMSERKPHIYDDELIIGNMTSKRIAANYYHEGGSINIVENIFRLKRRQIPLLLNFGEKLTLLRIAASTLFASIGARALLRPGRFRHFMDFFRAKRYFITEEAGIGHQVGGYWNVVHHGLRMQDEIAARCLESGTRPDGTILNEDNRAFYQSVRITIEGIVAMAARLADEAERMAMLPGISPERRAELMESAAACRHVPYHPARTYLEGLQSCWLVHIALNLEDFEQGMSFGRLDRILYPLFLNDLRDGRITMEKAVELMAGFQLKTCETMPIYSERIDTYFSGNAVAQGITVGGTDEHGNDTTNILSCVVLDAFAQIRTREPAIHVRVHGSSPQWFIDRAVEVLQLGAGKPSFFGDEAIVRALEGAGITREHARDYAVIGCVEMASQGRTYNSSDAALFNIPLCLELALNEGRRFSDLPFLHRRFGARTPAVDTMTSFDDVVSAFRAQMNDSVDEMARIIGWLEDEYRTWRTTPVNSIVTEGCMDSGLDVTRGGALYDLTSIQAVGLADAGDSLYAIKHLVYDHKRLSLREFVDILKADFRGHEQLRAELARKLPRFGNGIPEADRMTQLAADVFSEAIRSHTNGRGGRYVPGVYSMTCFIGFGRHTGALPNGRKSGEMLSNGLSPSIGADHNGPTGVLNSAASMDTSLWANCTALNLKFDSRSVQGPRGRMALSALLHGYFDQGGMQVQINVLDADILRKAKADPAGYPGIVVRVAGYCAYFSDLQPEVQDEIIARTSHGIQ